MGLIMVPFAGLSEVWILCRSGAHLHKCALAQSRDSREGTERLIPLKDGDVLLLSHAARVALHSSRLLSCGGKSAVCSFTHISNSKERINIFLSLAQKIITSCITDEFSSRHTCVWGTLVSVLFKSSERQRRSAAAIV